MNFAELKTAVKDYCALSSSDADTRVGKALNRHYRRITSSLGLNAARFVTRSATMTLGVSTVTFTSIEKIDRILDTTTAGSIRPLNETSVDEIRSLQPGAAAPNIWATQNITADTVTALFDTVPQSAYSLQADGWTSVANLSGTDEPAFPESFHDILVWFVISEELLKKEKDKLADKYERKAERLLEDLRFHLAESYTHDTPQAGRAGTASSSSSSGSGGTSGATSYTQSGLLTFDRGAGIVPMAVARSDAPYVPNLGAEFLGNITTDRLIGRDTAATGETEQLTVGGGLEFTGSGGIQRSALTGDVTASAGSAATTIAPLAVTNAKVSASAGIVYSKLNLALSILDADINASAAIAWSKVSKSGSSLADLATRSAADLSSGTVAEARLGSGTGSVNKVLRGNSTWGDPPGITTDGSSAVQQIAFAATQSPSSNANTFDDYEEGSWTPADASGATLTITANSCRYVKKGKDVSLYGDLTYPATASGSAALLSGLPFTADLNQCGALAMGGNVNGTIGTILEITNNTAQIQPRNADTGAALTNANLTTVRLKFSGVYQASA